MAPYRTTAPRLPREPDADVTGFAARVRQGKRLQRAGGLAVLALLSLGPLVPFVQHVARHEAPSSTPMPWGQPGRLPVHASVLWPGMCNPDYYDSEQTRFALSVAQLEECPWL
jgi:hypothetical protein